MGILFCCFSFCPSTTAGKELASPGTPSNNAGTLPTYCVMEYRLTKQTMMFIGSNVSSTGNRIKTLTVAPTPGSKPANVPANIPSIIASRKSTGLIERSAS